MTAYLYCQLKYTYWRSVCQHFLIFIRTHQAHNENFPKHQNLAKNRLFCSARHMLCHMCATKKNLDFFSIIPYLFPNRFWSAGTDIGRYQIDQPKVKKYSKRCTKINFICSMCSKIGKNVSYFCFGEI